MQVLSQFDLRYIQLVAQFFNLNKKYSALLTGPKLLYLDS